MFNIFLLTYVLITCNLDFEVWHVTNYLFYTVGSIYWWSPLLTSENRFVALHTSSGEWIFVLFLKSYYKRSKSVISGFESLSTFFKKRFKYFRLFPMHLSSDSKLDDCKKQILTYHLMSFSCAVDWLIFVVEFILRKYWNIRKSVNIFENLVTFILECILKYIFVM